MFGNLCRREILLKFHYYCLKSNFKKINSEGFIWITLTKAHKSHVKKQRRHIGPRFINFF